MWYPFDESRLGDRDLLFRLQVTLKADDEEMASQAAGGRALPPWSWSTVQIHAHCSNVSGTVDMPLRPEIARFFSTLPFVVIEKTQGLASAPTNREAGRKQIAAAAQIKRFNASAIVLAYYQTDWVRRWFDSGLWFAQHSQYCLRNSSGSLIVGKAPDLDLVYDYSEHQAQWMWAKSLASMSNVDGWFIDGPFSISAGQPFGRGPFAGVNASAATAWTCGLQQTLALLRNLSGPDAMIVREHDPHTQCDQCTGLMQQGWCKSVTGNDGILHCINDLMQAPPRRFHEINCGHCGRPSDQNISLAIFLLGVRERMYFGHDSWSDCEVPFQLHFVEELSFPLGTPLGNFTVSNVRYTFTDPCTTDILLHNFLLNCAHCSGGDKVYSRRFDGSGQGRQTVVTVRTAGSAAEVGASGGGTSSFSSVKSACIDWANGVVTGVGCV